MSTLNCLIASARLSVMLVEEGVNPFMMHPLAKSSGKGGATYLASSFSSIWYSGADFESSLSAYFSIRCSELKRFRSFSSRPLTAEAISATCLLKNSRVFSGEVLPWKKHKALYMRSSFGSASSTVAAAMHPGGVISLLLRSKSTSIGLHPSLIE